MANTQITQLLVDWKNGSKESLDLLIPLVYQEMRRLADSYLRDERSAQILQPTALVHEAYLRMIASQLPDWESRAHFFGVAARLMRQILVDHARKTKSHKRGSGALAVPLEQALGFTAEKSAGVVALDDALNQLAEVDSRKCQIIELRFFGGFSSEETAQALGVSVSTVGREQRLAEAWLYREMEGRGT